MQWSYNHLFVKKPGLCQAVHLFYGYEGSSEEKVGFLPARCRCFGFSQHNLDLFKPLHVTSAHMIHKITYKHPAASVNYSCHRLLLILFLSDSSVFLLLPRLPLTFTYTLQTLSPSDHLVGWPSNKVKQSTLVFSARLLSSGCTA